MILAQLPLDIESFLLLNVMKDTELNDAGCGEHGDLFAIIDFHSLQSLQENRTKLFMYLQKDIAKNYGDFIESFFEVQFGIVNGSFVAHSQFIRIMNTLEPIETNPRHYNKPLITNELVSFFEESCQGTFQLNDDDYGEEFIDLSIQVDSYESFLKYEKDFYAFLLDSTSKYHYKYAQIHVSIGVYLVKGESVNQTSYVNAINKAIYGIE